MKTYALVLTLLAMMVVAAMPAYATVYDCVGAVTMLAISHDGIVLVGGPGGVPGGVFVCHVDMAANGWTQDGCKAAYATLLALKLSGQPASLQFTDNLTCQTQPTFNSSTELSLVMVGQF